MSNIFRLSDRERRICAVTPRSDIDVFRSLFDSWHSITLDVERLQDYIDQLRLAVDAIAEGPEKSNASLLMEALEIQIRDCHIRSIGANAAVARALVKTLTI
jgi:hypothetical protein